MTRSPQNIRIENRQKAHIPLWNSDEWAVKRILFLTHPVNRGGCVWCGNIANVVEHPHYEFYGTPEYMDFWKAGCVPMCSPCNDAKRQQKVLCPRCRRQFHYCPPGEVCWDCRDDKEKLLFTKEQRNRDRNKHNRKRYRDYHPKKVIRDGKWVTL